MPLDVAVNDLLYVTKENSYYTGDSSYSIAGLALFIIYVVQVKIGWF